MKIYYIYQAGSVPAEIPGHSDGLKLHTLIAISIVLLRVVRLILPRCGRKWKRK